MSDKIATRDAFASELVVLAESDERICALDADLSASTKSSKFAGKYPDRFFNAGIAEQNMIGIASGLATCGKIPVASTFAVFATGRVYDQIRMTVAYPRLSVKIAATHGGLTVGEDGASHQALEDIALMRVLPNMKVLVPADGPSAQFACQMAIDYDGPVYVRLGRPGVPVVYGEGEVGACNVLRDGRDVAIIACGVMVNVALTAADRLKADGIEARVVDMMSIKPIDAVVIGECARECGAIVTVEEHSIIGGLGSAVCEVVSEQSPVPVVRVGVKDSFGLSGSGDELLSYYGLDETGICEASRQAIGRK